MVKDRVTGPPYERSRGAEDELRAAIPDWIRNGKLVRDVALVPGDNKVVHGLGHKPRGWVVVRLVESSATDYPAEPDPGSDDVQLTLNATDAMTVDLWVW